MVPGAGILLTERLYIGIKVNSVISEAKSEYADKFFGSVSIDILAGRNQGFVVICDGITKVSSNGIGITFDHLNGAVDKDRHNGADSTKGFDYTLDIYDRASLVKNSVVVHIGYNTGDSYVRYDSTNYIANQSFYFPSHH